MSLLYNLFNGIEPFLLCAHQEKEGKKKREKYKISLCGLLDLQFTHCGIKTNSKVLAVYKKNNLVPTVKFHPLS
jgi:hypothetical protein